MSADTPKFIAPPPPRRNSRLAPPPIPAEAPNNLNQPNSEGAAALQDMNFKVKSSFHTEFKSEATIRGLSMKEFLEACFHCYLDVHGSKLNSRHKKTGP